MTCTISSEHENICIFILQSSNVEDHNNLYFLSHKLQSSN